MGISPPGPHDGDGGCARCCPALGQRGATVIRVMLVDDQELVRAGLRGILRARFGFEIVAELSDGAGVIAAVEGRDPTSYSWTCGCPGSTG